MPRIKTAPPRAPERGPDWIWCMVSDGMEVEFMAKFIRLMATLAAVSLAAPAWSQDTAKNAPVRVVTKTLVASEAQKECLSLNNRQRLHYKFRADGPLNFKLSHQEEKEVIDFKR